MNTMSERKDKSTSLSAATATAHTAAPIFTAPYKPLAPVIAGPVVAAPVVPSTAPVLATAAKDGPPPNPKPHESEANSIETYVYRDFSSAEASKTGASDRMPPQSLQSQKLPSKLAAMLYDPDLVSVITWMPHGRSWKILNRELFSSFALPRYFGHSNHASFVRIVNAWGFRRISVGVDRDSYYHELFLRSKPHLHQRMKRLPSCHRKTPVDKDDKCPDFYDLAKTSPLPEVTWSNTPNQIPGNFASAVPASGVSAFPTGMKHPSMAPYMPETVKPIHYGDASGAFSSSAINGLIGSGMVGNVGMVGGVGMGGSVGMGGGGLGANSSSSYGMAENPMLSLLGINNGGNGSFAQQQPTDASTLNTYTQNLQRENENLMLKIKLLEYENQAKQMAQQQQHQHQHQQQQQQQHPWSGSSNQQHNIIKTEGNAANGGVAALGFSNALKNSGSMVGATAMAAAPSHGSNNVIPGKTA